MRLAGRVAVITGGGSGIGAATARLFAREGARVCVMDRDADAAGIVAAEINTAGGTAMARASDVGVPGTAEADAAAVLAEWNRIDALVCAAGFSSGGTWLWAPAVIPAMQRQGGGSIVTLASQLARAGGRNNAAYIAAKGAILSLTKTMALDFVADGIRVNAILPGAIDTPLLARSFGRHRDPATPREASRTRHPMARFGRAEEGGGGRPLPRQRRRQLHHRHRAAR